MCQHLSQSPETVTYVEPEPEPVPVVISETVAPPIPAVILEPEPEVRERVTIREEIVPEVLETVVAPVVMEPVAPIVKKVDDDLTKIKGIGLPVALELKRIGITHFAQVARWTDHDVAHISKQLAFSGRIEREKLDGAGEDPGHRR